MATYHEDYDDQHAVVRHEADTEIYRIRHQYWCCRVLTWVGTITDSHLAGVYSLLTEGAESHNQARPPHVSKLMLWDPSPFPYPNSSTRQENQGVAAARHAQDLQRAILQGDTTKEYVGMVCAPLLLLALAQKRCPAVC